MLDLMMLRDNISSAPWTLRWRSGVTVFQGEATPDGILTRFAGNPRLGWIIAEIEDKENSAGD